MNYFLINRHPRRLTLLLALCLVLAMFTGCQKTTSDEPSDASEEAPPGLVEVLPTEEATEPPTTEPENENMATVGAKQADVRSSPSSGAKIIGFLDPGTEVEIIKTEVYQGKDWALIREGWIELEYVTMNNGTDIGSGTSTEDSTEPTTQTTTNTTSITGTVTATDLLIRPDASSTGEPVGSYSKGTVITILETKNNWGRTDKGWVSLTYVNTNGAATNTTTTNNNNTNTTNATTDGSTYFVTASELNIRDSAVNGNRVGGYVAGDKVTVIETSNGWGRTDKGWVSMDYLYKTGATGTNTGKGVVLTNGLQIRTGPATGYDSVGSYTTYDRVIILEQINGWGCTSKGWISLDYVYIDGTKGTNTGTGTVSGNNVYIRSGPGTGYEPVGSLNSGDTVEILEQFTIDGMTWGCFSKGWVCMDYVGVG